MSKQKPLEQDQVNQARAACEQAMSYLRLGQRAAASRYINRAVGMLRSAQAWNEIRSTPSELPEVKANRAVEFSEGRTTT